MTPTEETKRPPLAWMWWIPAVVWAALIFYLSSKTSSELPKVDIPYLDKVVQFILFGSLALLTFSGFRFGSGSRFWKAAALAFVIASAYGASDEIHQIWTPGRSSDVFDWVADTLGASGVFLTAVLRGKLSRD